MRAFWSSLLILLGLIAAFAAGRTLFRIDPIPTPRMDLSAYRANLRLMRTADSLRLVAWADSAARLRGDSLASAARAYWQRHRPPARLIRDTIELPGDTVTLPGLVVREMVVSDSACRDQVDSLTGSALLASVEAAEDSAALADHLAGARRERWTWAAGGAAAGLVASLLLVVAR